MYAADFQPDLGVVSLGTWEVLQEVWRESYRTGFKKIADQSMPDKSGTGGNRSEQSRIVRKSLQKCLLEWFENIFEKFVIKKFMKL